MIIITGAAGFIGSCLVSHMNQQGKNNLVIVDQFDRADKRPNLAQANYLHKIERSDFIEWLNAQSEGIDFIIHLGARTDTTEKDRHIFDALNLNYTKAICQYCTIHQVPLIYASSAATYGLGEHGYDDNTNPKQLKPLNPYGDPKNDLDQWLLADGLSV